MNSQGARVAAEIVNGAMMSVIGEAEGHLRALRDRSAAQEIEALLSGEMAGYQCQSLCTQVLTRTGFKN